MAEHKLPTGKRWIENLLELGRALGYRAEPEFDVTPGGPEEAPVDVAWLGSADARFPLFIFEVETKPTGQMAYNAGKVFGQDTALFQKPLFHFHLVLEGGQTSGRIQSVTDVFGKFNYGVYRIAETGAKAALADIFSQHRRVRSEIDVLAIAEALEAKRWGCAELDELWEHIEDCGFTAPWARSYAELALIDPAFMVHLTRILLSESDADTAIDPDQYGTFLASSCSGLLHGAIVAQERPELAPQSFERVKVIQGESGVLRYAPRYGLSQEYDGLIFAFMPAIWALLAASFAHVEGARVWVLEQMEIVIAAQARIPFVLSALTALWMLHVASSGGEQTRSFYERAAAMLNDGGGVAPELLHQPPLLGAVPQDLDSWWERLTGNAAPVPAIESFRRAASPAESGVLTRLALGYLLQASPPQDPTGLLRALG